MENTFDIETLATISSGKKERVDDEPSISNRLGVCFVAIASSEKRCCETDRLLTRRYTSDASVLFREGERALVARNGMLNVTSVYLRLNRCYVTTPDVQSLVTPAVATATFQLNISRPYTYIP